MTQAAIDSPLAFQPGTRYSYCSTSFLLLTRLIEKLSGQNHVAYLRERVLDPLGMESTYDPRRSKRPIVAVQGVGVDSRLMRFIVLRYLAAVSLPGGGLFGTLDDILRFGAGTLRPRREGDRYAPLSPGSIALMQQDQLGDGVPGDVRRRGTAGPLRTWLGQAHPDAPPARIRSGRLARRRNRDAHLGRPRVGSGDRLLHEPVVRRSWTRVRGNRRHLRSDGVSRGHRSTADSAS